MHIQGEDAPDPDEVAVLERGVADFTVSTTHHDDLRELAGFVRDEHGAVLAGVYGLTWGGCCELQYLWVHPSLRGDGLGGLLLQWAEDEARVPRLRPGRAVYPRLASPRPLPAAGLPTGRSG